MLEVKSGDSEEERRQATEGLQVDLAGGWH